MQEITQSFLNELESQGLNYNDVKETQGREIVNCGVHGKIMDYMVLFIFTGEHDVEIAAMRLATCPENKKTTLLPLISDFNAKHRWFKLVIMPDGSVNLRADSVVSPETSGAICIELFLRAMPIIENILPEINKIIWA